MLNLGGKSRVFDAPTPLTLPLPDGRRLGPTRYGDPAHRPVVFHHGFGSSGLKLPDDAALLARHCGDSVNQNGHAGLAGTAGVHRWPSCRAARSISRGAVTQSLKKKNYHFTRDAPRRSA